MKQEPAKIQSGEGTITCNSYGLLVLAVAVAVAVAVAAVPVLVLAVAVAVAAVQLFGGLKRLYLRDMVLVHPRTCDIRLLSLLQWRYARAGCVRISFRPWKSFVGALTKRVLRLMSFSRATNALPSSLLLASWMSCLSHTP
jgi:hypothetical protein